MHERHNVGLQVRDCRMAKIQKQLYGMQTQGVLLRDLYTCITGGHSIQDPPYTQKPIYYAVFADHI